MGSRLVLAAAYRGEPVWLMDLDDGRTVPMAADLQWRGAFDIAQGRAGWTAVQVEYHVGALVDGSDALTLLPFLAWRSLPAAGPSELLLRLQAMPARDDVTSLAVVSADGAERRSALLPIHVNDGVVGEVAAGVVSRRSIVSWDGRVTALPADVRGDDLTDPRPFGVLDGRVIVLEGTNYVETVDTATGARTRVELPPLRRGGPFHVRFGTVSYNASATWLVAHSDIGSIIVGATGVLRWLPGVGRMPGMGRSLWDGERLLLLDDPVRGTIYYHPALNMWEQTQTAPIDWDCGPAPRIALPRL